MVPSITDTISRHHPRGHWKHAWRRSVCWRVLLVHVPGFPGAGSGGWHWVPTSCSGSEPCHVVQEMAWLLFYFRRPQSGLFHHRGLVSRTVRRFNSHSQLSPPAREINRENYIKIHFNSIRVFPLRQPFYQHAYLCSYQFSIAVISQTEPPFLVFLPTPFPHDRT